MLRKPRTDDEMPTPEQVTELTLKWVSTINESLGVLVDAVAGHKNRLIQAGFGEAVAESMAIDLHINMIRTIFPDE